MPDRLTIINHMLNTVGERGVTTLDSLHPSVQTAKAILATSDETFQNRGWWFNTEYAITLTTDNLGKVGIPEECLEFKIAKELLSYADPNTKRTYVKRGNFVYDASNHTYIIGQTLAADLVLQLPIEDMPSQASNYLMHYAAEAMFLDDEGDAYKGEKLKERTMQAWNNLRAAELKALATNSRDAPMARTLQYRIGQWNGSGNPMFPGGR